MLSNTDSYLVNSRVGAALADLRKACAITRNKVAEAAQANGAVKFSAADVKGLEEGTRPWTVRTIRCFAAGLGMSTLEVIGVVATAVIAAEADLG